MVSIDRLKNMYEPGGSSYEIPKSMPALVVRKDASGLCHEEVPVPEIGHDEALVAVMAAGVNFNTIWTIRGEPVSSFDFLKRLSTVSNAQSSHNLDYHIPGSDASGVVVKLGNSDTKWKLGDSVVINCNWHRSDDPQVFEDSMISSEQKIWGYETNFGSFAAFTVVKLHQMMPKPDHLTWVEAASYSLVLCTAYRMLLTSNGASIGPGDRVLIWGGAGGLGLSAIQLCLIVGAVPIPVVSTSEKGEFLREKLGVEEYIDRSAEGLSFWKGNEHNILMWRKFSNIIRSKFGGPPDVVFEHPGRDTMAASVYVLKKGGKVVTCAATTGYDIEYDNRYLWMESKSIIGCHFANPLESRKANQLVVDRKIKPFVSSCHPFSESDKAIERFESNQGFGKIVVEVLSEERDPMSHFNLF